MGTLGPSRKGMRRSKIGKQMAKHTLDMAPRASSDTKEIERELLFLNIEYLLLKNREHRQQRLDTLIFFAGMCVLVLGLLILMVLMLDKDILVEIH